MSIIVVGAVPLLVSDKEEKSGFELAPNGFITIEPTKKELKASKGK